MWTFSYLLSGPEIAYYDVTFQDSLEQPHTPKVWHTTIFNLEVGHRRDWFLQA